VPTPCVLEPLTSLLRTLLRELDAALGVAPLAFAEAALEGVVEEALDAARLRSSFSRSLHEPLEATGGDATGVRSPRCCRQLRTEQSALRLCFDVSVACTSGERLWLGRLVFGVCRLVLAPLAFPELWLAPWAAPVL